MALLGAFQSRARSCTRCRSWTRRIASSSRSGSSDDDISLDCDGPELVKLRRGRGRTQGEARCSSRRRSDEVSTQRVKLHERLASFSNPVAEEQERELSEKRRELHAEIDRIRGLLDE